jgi:frataxin
MSDSAFETLADSLIDTLEEGLGDDVERQGGVLTIEADEGTWVINKHAPTRQIWLSSPKSGARHFAFDEASRLWKDTRGGSDLLTAINAELGVMLDWQPE